MEILSEADTRAKLREPIAVALLEAKKNTEPPDKGLEQAKRYARLNKVPFVYSSGSGKTFIAVHLLKKDEEITANNLQYFGEPVYEYDMAQGIEDGYLPACEIIRRDINLDLRGVSRTDIEVLGAKDATTGRPISPDETREKYEAQSFEDVIQLPDIVKAMCKDLFDMLLETGGPHQKTVIFCTRDSHADAVASVMKKEVLRSDIILETKRRLLAA